MWVLSVLIALSLSNGLMAADLESDLERCMELSNIDNVDLEKIEDIELETACPIITEFMECVEGVLQVHTGFRLTELADLLSGTDVGKVAQLMVNVKAIIGDLCTKGSELNTKYKENEACLETISPNDELCAENAAAAFEAYSSLEEASGNGHAHEKCMTEAYKSACLGAQIHKTCGQESFEVYQTLVKRLGLFRDILCSPEALEELKTKFANNLELSEHQKNVFRAAFDLRRRRK